MVQRPGSLPEFEERSPDEAACARWLFGKRWPDGFRCPGCGHAKGWEPGLGTLLVECARCRRQTSVTAGTVLHRSPLPLKLWFLAAWLVATHRNGISARQPWLQLGLGSYKTAWLLLRKLRRARVCGPWAHFDLRGRERPLIPLAFRPPEAGSRAEMCGHTT